MLAKPDFVKRFREFVLSGDSARLPTIYELARKFDVPRPWIQTIVRQLRDEGVLKVSRRGGITLKRFENHPAAQPLLSREDALYRLVRSRIESGAYRLGQPLPKTGLIAKSERVCTANVGHVYRRLVTERLVSRVGRTFIVGPGGLHGYPQSSHQGKCVLMTSHYPGGRYVSVYEAGFCGFWIHRELTKLAFENIIVNPSDVPSTNKERDRKPDLIDNGKPSRERAHNSLTGIFVPDVHEEALRCLTRLYKQNTRRTTQTNTFAPHLSKAPGSQFGTTKRCCLHSINSQRG